MEQVRKILHKTRNVFMKKKNVIGVGVGYKHIGMERTKRPALIVLVEKKEDAEQLHGDQLIPKTVAGTVTDVIETGPIRLLDLRTDKLRPAKPGMSIGHYKITAGTFGAVVRDIETGEKLILSNNHILANATDGKDGRAMVGDPIYQPGVFDGGCEQDCIAFLHRFIPLQRSIGESQCPVAMGVAGLGNAVIQLVRPNYKMKFVKRFHVDNKIDAAVARPIQTELLAEDIFEIGNITGVGAVGIDDIVQKSGRSSGLTSGEVLAMGASLQVQLSDTDYGVFSDQIVCKMPAKGGDSGSLVLDQNRRAVGLLFAGSEQCTVFNRIDHVLSALKVEF